MLAQVIVARKVLLMSMFQLYDPLFAVLLATAIVMVSLAIHIGARPFEDSGTDWTEMLSLCAQLITLVAGPVFIVLVRIDMLPCTFLGRAIVRLGSPSLQVFHVVPRSYRTTQRVEWILRRRQVSGMHWTWQEVSYYW